MSGPRSGRVVELRGETRASLEALTRRTTVAVGVARRARIVLLAADGVPLDRIAQQLGVDRNVVRTWVDRYRGGGRAALRDRPRSGRPRTFSPGGGAAPGAARL
jgi:class 3 adenylate cyclase